MKIDRFSIIYKVVLRGYFSSEFMFTFDIVIRLRQIEFPFLIRWTSKNLAALPKEKNDDPEKKRSQK